MPLEYRGGELPGQHGQSRAAQQRHYFKNKENRFMKRTLMVSILCLALAGAGGFGVSRALPSAPPGETAVKELPSYREVVKRVLPAVVSIEAKRKAPLAQARQPSATMPPFGNLPGLPDELRKDLERFHVQ